MEAEFGRLFFEACPEALMALRNGRVAHVNEEMRRLLGKRSGSEIMGRRIEEIIPMDMDNRDGIFAALSRILPGDVRTFDWELMLPDSVYIPVVIRATGLGGGMMLLSVRDSTDSRERNRAMSELEGQRRALLEATLSPVFCIGSDFGILWCNDSFSVAMGESQGILAGRKCFRMLSGNDEPCAGCPAVASMRIRGNVCETACGDGGRWVASASSFRDPDGSPSGTVVVLSEAPGVFPGKGGKEFARPASIERNVIPAGVRLEPQSPVPLPENRGAVDIAGWLSGARDSVVSALGGPVGVHGCDEPVCVRISEDHLLDAFRHLAGSDYGTCLAGGEGILVRLDSAILEEAPQGIDPGRYVSVSIGARSALEKADSHLFSRSFYNLLSPFPMSMPGTRAGGAGAVFVSRTDDSRKFYQIMIPMAEPSGSAVE